MAYYSGFKTASISFNISQILKSAEIGFRIAGTYASNFKTASIGQLDLLSHSLATFRSAGGKTVRIAHLDLYRQFLGL